MQAIHCNRLGIDSCKPVHTRWIAALRLTAGWFFTEETKYNETQFFLKDN